jgi:hypothetical protein
MPQEIYSRKLKSISLGDRMEPKAIREFIKLIREHFPLQAEVRTLASILETAVYLNQPPIGWLNMLKLVRKTPDYRSISEQYAPLLAQFEESADANELARLISTIPPTQPFN